MINNGIVFSDVDGTLIEKDSKIVRRNIDSFKSLRCENIRTVIASGRTIESLKAFSEENELDLDYWIGLNGAIIVDRNFRKIFEKSIELESIYLVDRVLKKFLKNSTFTYCTKNGESILFNHNESIKTPIYSMNICVESYNPEYRLLIKRELESALKGLANIFINQGYIDISPSEISKGNGINFIRKLYSDKVKVFSIGDSWNDVSMFQNSDVSATFKKSDQELKETCDYVVEHFYQFTKIIKENI